MTMSEHGAPQLAAREQDGRDDRNLYLDLYRRMLLIRRFEDLVQKLYERGLVHGTTHLYSGQEAVAVGVSSVLQPRDRVAGTYRGHGHSLARGLEPQKLLDELLGRRTGICGGRAGSMNVVDLEHGLIGCFGIVGGSIAAATGAALALKRTGGVAVAYFGDGATNQGYFHECLNFAKTLGLPVVYVCENNLYGEFTPMHQVTAGEIASRPRAMGIPVETIDGNSVWIVRDAACRAVEAARRGGGPSFIEALTYRFVGHSRSDPGKYRAPGEMDRWRARDPLALTRAWLSEHHRVSEQTLDAVADAVEQEVEELERAAVAAPFPDPAAPVSEFKSQ